MALKFQKLANQARQRSEKLMKKKSIQYKSNVKKN